MKIVLGYIILSILMVFLFNFLDYGNSWDKVDKFIFPIIFTTITLTNFLNHKLRKLFLVFAIAILALMILTYLLGELALANTIGSFGFALFVISIISYIPELVKKGYIEKI